MMHISAKIYGWMKLGILYASEPLGTRDTKNTFLGLKAYKVSQVRGTTFNFREMSMNYTKNYNE